MPAGYVWSFSGDTSPISDLMGSISGQISSVGSLIGTIGLAGGIAGGITGGIAGGITSDTGVISGRGRTIEEDDLEVLELLGLL